MSSLATPLSFSWASGQGGFPLGFQQNPNEGCNTPDYPCCAGPTVDPLCTGASSGPSSPSSPGSGGSSQNTLGAILGLGQNVLHDVLGYKLQSQQVAAGQYPGQTGPFGTGGVGNVNLGGLSLGGILPILLIGLVLLLVFRAIK